MNRSDESVLVIATGIACFSLGILVTYIVQVFEEEPPQICPEPTMAMQACKGNLDSMIREVNWRTTDLTSCMKAATAHGIPEHAWGTIKWKTPEMRGWNKQQW